MLKFKVVMSSQSIQSLLFPPLPSLLSVSSLGLSEQNEKIYKLVVGKILPAIALGAFIACVMCSFIATPLFAIGAVGAFVIGLLGIAATYEGEAAEEIIPEEPPPLFVRNQPIGIRNGGNNCWANAMLQIVLNNPELERKFASQVAFREIFTKYRASQSSQTHICPSLTGGEARIFLHGFGVDVGAGFSQEDAGAAFEAMLGIPNGPAFYTLMQSVAGRDPLPMTEPMISLALQSELSFQQMFDLYFSCHNDQNLTLRKQFITAPQTLVVQLRRFTHQTASNGTISSVKNNGICDVPLSLTVTADKNRDNREARYECNGFILHLGSSLNGGHYVAYIQREGKWWYCSDSIVREASLQAVEAAKKNSYILSYAKV